MAKFVTRRQMLAGLAAVAGGAALAACAPAGQTQQGGATPATGQAQPQTGGQKVTIQYWASWTGLFEQMVKRISDAFMQKNPDVTVVNTVVPGAEMDQKLITGVASGTAPDVAMIWGANRVYSLYEQGAILPLEEGLDKQALGQFKEFVHPNIWALGNYGGKVVSVPQWTQAYCLIWNKKMADEAGVVPDSVKTVDDLFAAAMKLTKKRPDGSIEVIGWNPDAWAERQWGMWGGKFLNEKGDPDCTHPNNLAALEYIMRYFKEYDVKQVIAFNDAMRGGAQGTLDPMLGSKAAIMFEGPWQLGVMKETDPNFQYYVTNFPVTPTLNKLGGWTYGDHPSMIKGTKQPAAGGRFVQFLTGFGGEEEYTQIYLTGQRPHMPISEKLARGSAFKKVLDTYPGYDKYLPTLYEAEVLTPPKLPVAAFYQSRIGSNWEKARLGEMTPKQALETSTREAQEEYTKWKQQNKR